jgi:predicted metallopeptidase
MEHLPDHISGVLGPHSPQQAKRIWEFFKGMMR